VRTRPAETPLCEVLDGDRVRCLVCERRCVIGPGERGFCGVRLNMDGRLVALSYGALSAAESRPIEIKPFFHYWPGSTAMTISTWGCNFRCPWCQNWHLSTGVPPERGPSVPPSRVVEWAVSAGDEGVCVSFNEPTMLFEYSLDLFREASARGLYCCYVSNGYMTAEALDMLISSGMDGLKIDVKGGEEVYRRYAPGADWNVPWRNARLALSRGVHVELVYLVVTGVNDEEADFREACSRLVRELGPSVPIHFTRYFPAHRFSAPPTPLERLEEALSVASEEGVEFAYVGNVPGHPRESTYCPDCGERLIARVGWRVVSVNLSDGRCPSCGREIPIAGRVVKKPRPW